MRCENDEMSSSQKNIYGCDVWFSSWKRRERKIREKERDFLCAFVDTSATGVMLDDLIIKMFEGWRLWLW